VIRTSVRAAGAALLALALGGCSLGSRPVVRVAGRTATVDDFIRAARNVDPTEGGATRAPAAVLDGLVRDQLLLAAAHAQGLDTTAAYRQFRDATTERLLVSDFSAHLAPADPGVSEAEARRMWEWRKLQSDVLLIYSTEKPIIDLAQKAIANGMTFGQAADHFNAPGTLPPGGSLGLVSPGQLGPPLDDPIRTLPVGRIGGPYHSPQGWFLVEVRARIPAQPVPFELERGSIVEALRQMKQRQAITAQLFAMEREWHLVLDPNAEFPVYQLLTPARIGAAPPPNPSPAERKQVLATWKGGTYTLGDAFADLQRSDVRAPNASVTPAIRAWVESRAITRIGLAEAHRRHLDEESDFVRARQDELDRYLLEAESTTAMIGLVQPSDASAESLWNQVKARYVQPLEARVRWVETADTTAAAAVSRGAARGAPLAAAARAVDPSLIVHDQALRFPESDPAWGAVLDGAGRMAPGEIRGPELVNGRWRVLQLVEKREGAPEWAQLTPEMRMSVAGSRMEAARQMRFAAYLDSLKQALHPTVLAQNLRKVPWPPPGPADATP